MEAPSFPRNASDAAAQVRDLLQVSGWTQGRLSHEMGVTQPTVSRWLSGKQEPSFQQAMAIAYHALKSYTEETKEQLTEDVMIVGSLSQILRLNLPPDANAYKAKLRYGLKGPLLIGMQIESGARTPLGDEGSIVLCTFAEGSLIQPSSYYIVVTEDKTTLVRKVIAGTRDGLFHLVAPGLDPILNARVARPFVVIGSVSPDAVCDLKEVGPDEYEFAY